MNHTRACPFRTSKLRLAVTSFALLATTAAAAPRKVALLEVHPGRGVSAPVAVAATQVLEAELRKREGIEVSSAAESRDALGVERQRQVTGCASEACLRRLDLEDLSFDDLIDGSVERSAGLLTLSIRHVELRSQKVTTATARVAQRDASQLAAQVPQLLAQVYPPAAAAPVAAAPDPPRPPPAGTPPSADSAPSIRALRVALIEPRITGEVPARAAAALAQSLAPEVRKLEAVAAVSSAELQDMLSAERQKQMLGCSDDAGECLAELAGAIDADELLTFDLTLVGTSYALSARRLNMRRGRTSQSYLKQFERQDGEELLAVVGPMVQALYPDRALKPGRQRGVEPEVIRRLNPPPLPRWVFFGTAGAGAAAGAVGVAFGSLALDAKHEHASLAERSLLEPVRATDLAALAAKAHSRAQTANVCFGIGGGLALAAVIEAFFTDWQGYAVAPLPLAGGGGAAVQGAF